ncbi:MAG: UbiA family prenyltransferase [Candidatus Latescibacterota bacterium]|nr:MAG: UbiA family prenyltransferase [Candidatus Latescibacterota bacterium]
MFVLRPVILIPAWSFYLIGASEGVGRSSVFRASLPSAFGSNADFPSLTAFTCLTAILVTAYLLNQIFDRESDERNNKCLFLSRGIFRARTLVLMALAFFLAASHAFHRTDDALRAPLIVALLMALVYSLPPIRLCARPFFDMFANAVGYGGVAFVLGYTALGSPTDHGVWLAVPYVLLVAATFLHTTILDVEGDKATGKFSTTVLIGVDRSVVLAAVLHACAVVVAIITGRLMAIVVTGVSFPATVYSLFRRDQTVNSFVIQVNTLVVTLAAAAAWPVYLLLVVPLILLSRYYHRRRFGFTYPGPRKTS